MGNHKAKEVGEKKGRVEKGGLKSPEGGPKFYTP
jgi:hypothetical protein